MSTLPTTPVGKQQLIDMKAGAILRGHARKSERYLGCPIRLLLTFIVLIKSSLLCGWLVREYFFFDFRCSLLSTSGADEEMLRRRSVEVLRIPVFPSDSAPPVNYFDEEYHERMKRYALMQNVGLDPRSKSTSQQKKSVARDVPTTMVTMTNTKLLPGEGDSLRMKTIRNRVKPISDMGDDDDDMLEIDIDAPPLVYISKILQRGEEDKDEIAKIAEKPKKRKGKGKGKKNKKKHPEEYSAASTTNVPPTTEKMSSRTPKKGRKGHRRKQSRLNNRIGTTSEQTKSPRHLVSPPGVPQLTTPRPHQSSFVHGVIDPKDPRFSNKGHIRGYPMHIASRKPTPSTRLSEETRLMWEMDELNYTTHAAAPKTTAISGLLEDNGDDPVSVSVVHLNVPSEDILTTTAVPTLKSFYTTHQLSTWMLTSAPPTTSTVTVAVTVLPVTRAPWVPTGVETEEEKKRRFGFGRPPLAPQRELSTLERLNNELPSPTDTVPEQKLTTPRPRPVKHGYDRSLDEAIDSGILSYPSERGSSKQDEQKPLHGDFQSQLSTFSSSATCIARTMFDLWSACQLLTLFPYLIGVCLARRSLFVSHLVLDILLLVVGFVYTITMIVFSVVLYVLIGEMPKEVLFEWILFALVLDAILLLYTFLVVISLRCCERIVQSRLTMKLQTSSAAAEAEQV